MLTTTTDVLVIGAGPTGLTLATLLARNGIRIRILDKKAGPSEESRALVVHAKTLELLDKLGLADQAIHEGQKLQAMQLLNKGKRSSKLSFLDESGRTPYPFALIYSQDQTEHLLIRELNKAGVQVEWNTELLSMEQAPTSIHAIIRLANGHEETIEADWLVGADGAHSSVRHTLSLGFEGESYKQALFLADVELKGELETRQATIGFTRLGFLAFFPMPGERRFRVIGALPLEFADRTTLTLDETQQAINTYKGLDVTITKAHWISVYRTHHRMSKRFRVGRVFLVGDAAHIHSPAGGQGMNTGIGDAYNLAWKLALVIKKQAQIMLLDSYEEERMPFARAILNGSDKGFQLQTMSQPLIQQFKMVGVPLLFRLVSDIPALRRKAFWFISQLWTSYRHSSAVMQTTPTKKGVQAGDRAPYGYYEAGLNAGKSIFTSIKGLDHHLILFTGGRLAIALTNLQQIEENLRSLLSIYKMPIHLHIVSAENVSLHKQYGVNEPGLFLIRPDGHIAYRGPAANLADLKLYLNKLFEQQENYVQTKAQNDPAFLNN